MTHLSPLCSSAVIRVQSRRLSTQLCYYDKPLRHKTQAMMLKFKKKKKSDRFKRQCSDLHDKKQNISESISDLLIRNKLYVVQRCDNTKTFGTYEAHSDDDKMQIFKPESEIAVLEKNELERAILKILIRAIKYVHMFQLFFFFLFAHNCIINFKLWAFFFSKRS